MIMLEKNSDEVARVIATWLDKAVPENRNALDGGYKCREAQASSSSIGKRRFWMLDEPPQAIAPSVDPENIVITLDRKGNMYWNGKLVQNEDEILAILAQSHAEGLDIPLS